MSGAVRRKETESSRLSRQGRRQSQGGATTPEAKPALPERGAGEVDEQKGRHGP